MSAYCFHIWQLRPCPQTGGQGLDDYEAAQVQGKAACNLLLNLLYYRQPIDLEEEVLSVSITLYFILSGAGHMTD